MMPSLRCALWPVDDCDTSPAAARAWLAPTEFFTYEAFHAPRRRAVWLAGRIAAKRLVQQLERDAERMGSGRCSVPATRIEIRSRNAAGQGVRPQVACEGAPRSWQLSVAHTERAVLVALTDASNTRVGVDLVDHSPRHFAGLAPWFTSAERRLLVHRPGAVPLLWGLKEAIYKACNDGEGFAPRRVESWIAANGQFVCHYRDRDLSTQGRVQHWRVDRHVAVLVTLQGAPPASSASPSIPSIHSPDNENPSDD